MGQMNKVQYCVGGIIGNDNLGLGTSWLVGDIFLRPQQAKDLESLFHPCPPVAQAGTERLAGELRVAFRKRITESVLVMDARLIDSVEHEIHRRNAEHGHVEIETVQ